MARRSIRGAQAPETTRYLGSGVAATDRTWGEGRLNPTTESTLILERVAATDRTWGEGRTVVTGAMPVTGVVAATDRTWGEGRQVQGAVADRTWGEGRVGLQRQLMRSLVIES